MLDITKTKSLSDFKRNTTEHVAELKESGQPEILTINGEAALVVQDAAAYQEMLRKADFADTVRAIKAGMAAHDRGEGEPLREALEQIAADYGFSLTES